MASKLIEIGIFLATATVRWMRPLLGIVLDLGGEVGFIRVEALSQKMIIYWGIVWIIQKISIFLHV